jgi:hypothetical protein
MIPACCPCNKEINLVRNQHGDATNHSPCQYAMTAPLPIMPISMIAIIPNKYPIFISKIYTSDFTRIPIR